MGNQPKERGGQARKRTVTALTHRPKAPRLAVVNLKAVNGTSPDRPPPESTIPAPVDGVRAIAFYLPQFHPTPENDRWWGKGFTEWTSVVSAKSLFPEHGQPHLPADLGFYDLRLAETRESQAELAREYGIHGFCYYYYWFSGRRLLDSPMADMLRTGRPDFPFCICWANEPWSRRWDGSEQEVLIAQEHDPKTDEGFILDVLPILKDPRYIRVGDAPLILVYRVGLLPAPHELFQAWRRIAREHGIPTLNICVAQTFGSTDPYHYGADSAVEFPPHGIWTGAISEKIADLHADYTGTIYDYREVVAEQFARPRTDYMKFRCAMPSWDNTPRRGLSGNVFAYSSPDQYELWLRTLVQEAAARRSADERLVFINAWNEWGEGAFLEPDQRHGRQYLEATRRALVDQSDWRVAIRQLEAIPGDACGPVREIAASLRQRFLALETANRFLAARLEQQNDTGDILQFLAGALYEDRPHEPGAVGYLEQVNRYNFFEETPVVRRDYPLLMKGWCFVPGHRLSADDPFFVTLHNDADPRVYTCAVGNREERRDVSEFHNLPKEEATWSGFVLTARIANLNPGSYTVTLNVVLKDRVVRCDTNREIFVL